CGQQPRGLGSLGVSRGRGSVAGEVPAAGVTAAGDLRGCVTHIFEPRRKETMAKKSEKKPTVGGSAKGPSPVEAIRHKDTRVNIPTHELRDFVKDDEGAPKTLLYPRDPSLDPQLVWKGKDEQDRQDLAVPVVPIYIQEKIHPQA